MIRLLTWNAQGVGNISTLKRLKKLISMHNISLIILQEPLISTVSEVSRKIGFDNFCSNINNKIWILSRHGLVVQLLSSSDQFLHFMVNTSTSMGAVCVTGIYATHTKIG